MNRVESDVEVIVLVGEDKMNHDDYFIQLYDIESGEWLDHVTIPRVQSDSALVWLQLGVVGNRLFFTGHTDMSGGEETFFGFDFNTKQITRFGKYEALTDCSARIATFDGNENFYYFSSTVRGFNINTQVVTNYSSFEEYAFGTCVYYNGFVYFVSWEYNGVYNVATKEIKPISNHKLECYPSVAVLNGKIYAIKTDRLTCISIYTPETDAWELIPTKGPNSIVYGQLITCNGRLICVESRCFVYEYDFEHKKWITRNRDYSGPILENRNTFAVKKCFVENW